MTTQHNNLRAEQKAVTEAGGVDKSGVDGAMTLEQLLTICVRLQPVEAARCGDSDLCVTPLITRLLIDGQLVDLKLKDGRWAGGYPRVSGEVQRAAGSAAGKTRNKSRRRKSTQQVAQGQVAQMAQGQEDLEGIDTSVFNSASSSNSRPKGAADGYSEEEQLTRQIRYFVRQGWAFKIYSDCGLTGEYPSNDPRLIRRLLEGKAARYKKIYERTLLDETSLLRRTPEQIASMRAYLEKRVALIKGGQITDDEFALSEDDLVSANDLVSKNNLVSKDALAPSRPVGRPRRKVFFRQAFTQLWKDIEAGKVHTIAVSDRSRLCRAADLESEFLLLLSRHSTRLVGLIEDLSTLDVSDPLRKGFAYMIASVNEFRLEEICGHSFRGLLQLLESGHPHGRPPWWMVRDGQGRAVEMPAYAQHARRIVELYLSGLGVAAIITKMRNEGVQIGGEPLTPRLVSYVLDSDAVAGVHWQFGLAWHLYPPLLPAATIQELRERRQSRRGMLLQYLGEYPSGRSWANHLYTGLLRCGCGRLLRYSHPSRQQRAAGKAGYYYCTTPHKRAEGAQAHAWMNEAKLSSFLEELLGGNPDLIANALSAGGDRAARSAARRTLLEGRLQQARQQYIAQEADAQGRAVQAALSAGLREESASFSGVVAEIRRGLLESERSALTALEEELIQLGAAAGQDKQAARVLAAVSRLEGGLCSGLDVVTRNSLLKTIFSEITIYAIESKKKKAEKKKAERAAASGTGRDIAGTDIAGTDVAGTNIAGTNIAGTNIAGTNIAGTNIAEAKTGSDLAPSGCLVLRLAGVDTPLPPVRVRRLAGKELRLPTVREWIADVYALAPVEDAPVSPPKRSFYYVLRHLVNGTAGYTTLEANKLEAELLKRLMACIRADKNFPKGSRGKETVATHLAQSDAHDEVRDHFEAAWTAYQDAERQRLNPRQDHRSVVSD